LVSLLKTAASAQKRSQAMNKWIESSKEALNTMNPYLTSIQNFVEGQRDQYTHYKIKLGILFIQFVSKLVSLAPGLVGAIGKIVDSGAAIAESLEEIIYKYKNRVKLEQAWKITKFALENPENRKANLKARRQNSTLSKYSIAFGAIVAKDVVAIGAMNRIGLNRETLSMPDANVNKVKEYLEERYDEDIQVKRQYTPLRGWASKFPDPELEPRKWMMSIQIASDFGELVNGRSNDISASFQNMRLARDEYDALNTQEEDLTLIGNKLLNRLQKLHESLHAFSPQNEAGSAISEVQTLRDRYIQITTDYATKITLDTTVAEEVDEE
jgi:hypothetical protein